MEKGYIQVYTGDGKGKTTAALGLSLRAAGAGFRIYIGQFLKKGEYSEIKALERFLDQIVVEQYGSGKFIFGEPDSKERVLADQGMEKAAAAIHSGRYDLVILEEVNVAVSLGLVPLDTMLRIMDEKPKNVELVLTGRDAASEILNRADLVTEMMARKHYFTKGVPARRGIES